MGRSWRSRRARFCDPADRGGAVFRRCHPILRKIGLCVRRDTRPRVSGEGWVLLCGIVRAGRGALCAPAGSRGRLSIRRLPGVQRFYRRCGSGRRRGMACLARLAQARPFSIQTGTFRNDSLWEGYIPPLPWGGVFIGGAVFLSSVPRAHTVPTDWGGGAERIAPFEGGWHGASCDWGLPDGSYGLRRCFRFVL